MRNNDFGDIEVLKEGIDHAHSVGGKFFLVSNIFPHGNKTKNYLTNMAPVIALKPDAMIMSDPGLIMMVRETWPEMEIHLSVQANTVNAAAVKFWKSVGISRVILSRELSLTKWNKFAKIALTPSWKCLSTVRCALPIQDAVCCQAISTTATRIKALAPTRVVGTTKRKRALSMPLAMCLRHKI